MNSNAIIIAAIASICIAGAAIGFVLLNDDSSDGEVHLQVSQSLSVPNDFRETASWSSTDSMVATVSADGVIKAVGQGKCKVIAVSPEGREMAGYDVKVRNHSFRNADVEVFQDDVHLKVGERTKLNPNQEVKWRSTDTSVATVDQDGNVTAVGSGRCEIIAYTAWDDEDVDVVVSDKPATVPVELEVYPDDLYIKIGEMKKLNANQEVKWRSTNTSVATVDDEGNVTAVGKGECEIIAYTQWDDEDVDVTVF